VGVVVDNRPGAAGLIAASEAARAPADGYTIMLAETGQLSIAPNTYQRLAYQPSKDFAPVSQVVSSDFVLLVNPEKVKARNVRDFVAWTRQQNGLFMATFGAGTPGHFGAYMFGDAVQSKPEVVHYKSTSDALSGIFSGDVQGVFASSGMAIPQVRAGKLVALGSTGSARVEQLPELPTMKEQGFGNLEFSSWFGIVAPARTPAQVVSKLNADLLKVLQSSDGRRGCRRPASGSRAPVRSSLPTSLLPIPSNGARRWQRRVSGGLSGPARAAAESGARRAKVDPLRTFPRASDSATGPRAPWPARRGQGAAGAC
jgi:tripartite-type tricarboxylate transporter receptor subunit TctC